MHMHTHTHTYGMLFNYTHLGIGEEVHFRIGAVADRDESSKVDDVTWESYLKTGTLTVHSDQTLSVKWDQEMITLKSHISEKGRGVELSELIVFNGKLYTIDDRSGIGELRVRSVITHSTCGGWLKHS